MQLCRLLLEVRAENGESVRLLIDDWFWNRRTQAPPQSVRKLKKPKGEAQDCQQSRSTCPIFKHLIPMTKPTGNSELERSSRVTCETKLFSIQLPGDSRLHGWWNVFLKQVKAGCGANTELQSEPLVPHIMRLMCLTFIKWYIIDAFTDTLSSSRGVFWKSR